ncbi:hypothetical protein Mgra_00005490 [Meloidogyne graminicola]|uniref:LAM_G_DOMAIN domain-containing protein n=1 Tax=Meloidogyne graminicola TaxID=189291 RepID=A0A8S9ZNP5_9BILA|nr:hypothetical protein Mgra_00005490 [Meloidogyne graminicola]
MLIPRPECQFELRSDKDKIRLNLLNLRKKYLKTSNTLSISFRTSKPNGRLIELIDGGNGPLGILDIIDGYLLLSNHIIHPSKLLTDGHWHTIHLHLHLLSIRIDNLGTSLSLINNSEFIEPKWIDILINGEIAAIRILNENSNDGGEKEWICNNNNDYLLNNNLIEVHQSLPQQHLFSQPAACSPSIYEQNYCNCKGPNSALIQNRGYTRNLQQQIAKCFLIPKQNNISSVHFSRYSDRLAFLFIPMKNNNFNLKTPISILFKSEKEIGLILFGVFTQLDNYIL